MRNITIKQIKEVYKNYKTVGNEKNSFVVTHYVGYGKCVIVVNSNKIYGKTITQIIRVEDGNEFTDDNIDEYYDSSLYKGIDDTVHELGRWC